MIIALILTLPVAFAGLRWGTVAGGGAGVAAGALQALVWMAQNPKVFPLEPFAAIAVLTILGGGIGELAARDRAKRLGTARGVWTSLRSGQVREFLSYVLYQMREYQISATSLAESIALSAPKDNPALSDKIERMRRVVGELNGKAARLLGENSIITTKRGSAKAFEVGALVKEAAGQARTAFSGGDIELAVAVEGGPLDANGDEHSLRLAVWAVLQNSLEACADRGKGSVSVVVRKRNETAEIEIVDDGGGVAVDEATLFEPFYSARSGSSGIGLGLSMARRMMDRLGGTVRLKLRPGVTAALIEFPLKREFPFMPNEETTWAKRRQKL